MLQGWFEILDGCFGMLWECSGMCWDALRRSIGRSRGDRKIERGTGMKIRNGNAEGITSRGNRLRVEIWTGWAGLETMGLERALSGHLEDRSVCGGTVLRQRRLSSFHLLIRRGWSGS